MNFLKGVGNLYKYTVTAIDANSSMFQKPMNVYFIG